MLFVGLFYKFLMRNKIYSLYKTRNAMGVALPFKVKRAELDKE